MLLSYPRNKEPGPILNKKGASHVRTMVIGLLIFQPIFQQHREYYLWLAGFVATLGMSFIFAILSARINGYRRYKDTLLGFAAGMMFLLCGVLAITGLFHL